MRWLPIANRHLGVTEFQGERHNPVIVNWLVKLGAWWRDDETPWCGVFVAAVLREAGVQPAAAWYRAKAWLSWGSALAAPALGCVVVFEREGGGHVGFLVGRTPGGLLLVLGGNQGNQVNVRAFEKHRVVGYRWPAGEPAPRPAALPVMTAYRPSEGEA